MGKLKYILVNCEKNYSMPLLIQTNIAYIEKANTIIICCAKHLFK
jgi:hypothetical protein